MPFQIWIGQEGERESEREKREVIAVGRKVPIDQYTLTVHGSSC